MAGRIDYMIDNVGLLAQQVAAGKILRPAITGPRRVTAVPDVPTMARRTCRDTNLQPMGQAVPARTRRRRSSSA